MNKYKIIQDQTELDKFIQWLPELEKNETYYVSLFARSKYDTTGLIKSDKAQLKRFTSDKQRLLRKIKQLEIEVGGYDIDGHPIQQEALALYIMPNPRSLWKAAAETCKRLVEIMANGPDGMNQNPQSLALNSIQKSCSRKIWMDFDYDNIDLIDLEQEIKNFGLTDCCKLVQTRGGFHVLVDPTKANSVTKNWYNSLKSIPGCDISGDSLIPMPGCCQGGQIPRLL